jgi:hypothetical protein
MSHVVGKRGAVFGSIADDRCVLSVNTTRVFLLLREVRCVLVKREVLHYQDMIEFKGAAPRNGEVTGAPYMAGGCDWPCRTASPFAPPKQTNR